MDESVIGEIKIFATGYNPQGWLYCNGTELLIAQNQGLFSILGTLYGGDGSKIFKIPFIPGGRTTIGAGTNQGQTFSLGQIGGKKEIQLDVKNLASHTHDASAEIEIPGYAEYGTLAEPNSNLVLAGNNGAYENRADTNLKAFKADIQVQASLGNLPISIVQPSLCLGYAICMEGYYPYDSERRLQKFGTLGEIIMFAGNNCESDSWLLCDGRNLDIEKYPELFKILGTKYGGNGSSTFAIPDFRGRVALGSDQNPEGTGSLGKRGGSNMATMQMANLPKHTHDAVATINIPASTVQGNRDNPENAVIARFTGLFSEEEPDVKLRKMSAKGQLNPQGDGDPFSIVQPYSVINYFICIKGYYPD